MPRTFHSLRHVNFRLWFVGTTIASTGMWMQRVAQDWLVLPALTDHDGFALGIVTALQFLPLPPLSPWAGAVVDRVERRPGGPRASRLGGGPARAPDRAGLGQSRSMTQSMQASSASTSARSTAG